MTYERPFHPHWVNCSCHTHVGCEGIRAGTDEFRSSGRSYLAGADRRLRSDRRS